MEDLIETTKNFTMMTWTMVTPASAKILSENVMLLEKDGKKLYIKVEGPRKIRWHILPAQSDLVMIHLIRGFLLLDLIQI